MTAQEERICGDEAYYTELADRLVQLATEHGLRTRTVELDGTVGTLARNSGDGQAEILTHPGLNPAERAFVIAYQLCHYVLDPRGSMRGRTREHEWMADHLALALLEAYDPHAGETFAAIRRQDEQSRQELLRRRGHA